MRKKGGILKKITSVLMAFLMVLSVMWISPKEADAATPKGYITLSMEKFTLGLGYIIEPVKVPFYEGDTGADIITRAMDDYGYEYDYQGEINDASGEVGSTFYLASVKDDDYRDAEIPQYILDEIEKDNGDLEGRYEEGWLGEFDYTSMSGWMYSVNNEFPNYGASMYKPKDGDVMRWQFTVWGYGADLEDNSEWGEPGYLKYANKDNLTKEVAEVNSQSKLLSNSEVKKAYNNAMDILQDAAATQTKVDKAYDELTAAVKEANIKLTAPTVKVGTVTTNTASISWDKVANATGYEVYRATGNDDYKLIKDISSASTLTYKDSSLTSNTTYKYKVKAYRLVDNNKKYSSDSNIVTLKTNEEVIPTPDPDPEPTPDPKPEPTPTVDKVSGFRVTSSTTSKINLAWNKVDDCDGYKIYRYYSSSDSFKVMKTISNKDTLTYQHTDRVSATTYRYKIRAYKVVNGKTIYSGYSDEIKATTNPLKPKFASSSSTKNSVTLNWNKVSRADGYEVYRYSTSSKKYSRISEVSANTTTYTNTGRTSANSYTYKIRAYKLVDGVKYYSNYSDSLKVTTKPLTPIVTLKSTVAGKATISWTNTSSRATGYKVYMATSKTGTYKLIKTTTSKSYTKTGLTKGKTYYFKVRAYRTVDGKNIYSDYSTVKSIKVKK